MAPQLLIIPPARPSFTNQVQEGCHIQLALFIKIWLHFIFPQVKFKSHQIFPQVKYKSFHIFPQVKYKSHQIFPQVKYMSRQIFPQVKYKSPNISQSSQEHNDTPENIWLLYVVWHAALWGTNRNSCFHKLSRPSKCVSFNVRYLLT